MADSTLSTATEFVATEIIDRMIIEAGYEKAVMPPLVKFRDYSDQPTMTLEVPKWNVLAATAPGEGTQATSETINPTSLTATAVRNQVLAVITDELASAAIVRELPTWIQQLALAIGVKVDTDILAEVADFAVSVGSSGVDLSEANILSAIYELEFGNVSQDAQLVAVLHAIQLADLRTDLTTSAADVKGRPQSMGGTFDFNGRRASYLGIPLIRSNLCASVGGNANRQGVMMPVGESSGLLYGLKLAARTETDRVIGTETELSVETIYADQCVDTTRLGGVAIITDKE
jgi:hypothetical protein